MPNDDPAALAVTASDRALLAAALPARAETAAAAWRGWRAAADLDALPDGQYLLLPALYANLARVGLAGEADPRIKGVYRRAWYANQRFTELGAAALAALDQAGIPAVLGGAAAVQDLYGGPGERPIGQIELLIAPADAPRAAAALGRVGWQAAHDLARLADPGYRLWVSQMVMHRPAPADARGDLPSPNAGQRPRGEGFGQAVDRRGAPAASPTVWRARAANRFGAPLVLAWRALPAAPGPHDAARCAALALDASAPPARWRREALLVLACARAAEGGPSRLLALADACMLLQAAAPLDWARAVELAGLLAAARPLAAALPLIEELAGAWRLEVAATPAKSACADLQDDLPARAASAGLQDDQPAQAGFAGVAAVSNRRGEGSLDAHLRSRLVQMAQGEPPYERRGDARGLAGRARYHLQRWRRIARGQGVPATPLSLLHYLFATWPRRRPPAP